MNDFLVQDRITKIKSINEQYDLEHNSYLSFSGGKDSVVLHTLLDEALPNNNIPRVFINTGIEYQLMVKFVKDLASKDDRIKVVNSGVNIKQMLEENGYPFKSKEHSQKVAEFQKNGMKDYLLKYANGEKGSFSCPKILRYQFTDNFTLPVSDKCCSILKKTVAKKWAEENNRTIKMTGMRKEEKGLRTRINCIITNDNGGLKAFHPLSVMSDETEEWYIREREIKLCDLYYPPFNFDRTGCSCCPYSLELQDQLDILERVLPNEKKKAEMLWKPVYDEYRRIGYRLRKEDKNSLF